MNFKLSITFSSDACVSWSGKGYYVSSYFDNIAISKGNITIEGKRGAPFTLEKILFNNKSTLNAQITKALSFYYLSSGYPLKIEKIELYRDKKDTEPDIETVFLQPFQKKLENHQTIPQHELVNIFNSNKDNSSFLNAVVYYIKALQDHNFDNYWKSFNSIYRIISTTAHEHNRLKDMRTFIENYSFKFTNTLNYIGNDTKENIRDLQIRDFILNTYENEKQTTAFAQMIKRFTDSRIINVLNDTLVYREKFLKKQGLYTDVKTHITKCLTDNKKDNVELLCFYVLKYIYFIRNKYFHAEKTAPYFILKDTFEIKETEKISTILQYFISDLIRCNALYL
ncbi:MAG: hypothetical protein E7562_00235 [Ruminococcaceae bacterium]|nr:hypothetical protein [Oscillospiraceae bacterium]